MKLTDFFENVPDIEIKSLMDDSRKKRPDSIFFCVKGLVNDGHEHIDEAIANGAIVIVHSEPLEKINPDVTYIKVKNVVHVFNQVADSFYDYPSHHMTMYGVTGTNGKSSVAWIIRNILNQIEPSAYVGTISIEYNNVKLPPLVASPNIDEVHGILRDMVDAGIKNCAYEASSIAIDQGRLDAIDFDVAIFTNLTHDHLDYHGTMTNYFNAKKKLFDQLKEEAIAIVNIDDPSGMKIVQDTQAKVFTYGIDHEADYRVTDYHLLKDSTRFTLHVNDQDYRLESNLIARFNIYNLVAAIAAIHQKGVSMDDIAGYIQHLNQVEGRMERIQDGQPFNLIVDFAHTADGIEKVCQYASSITPKDCRIIAITGSAGKRDTAKRPIFGEILDRYCDMIILTEDDSRGESVREIAEDIAKGIHHKNYVIIEDRYDAIRQSVELCSEGDTILVLGKGNEKFMAREFGREPYEGDDVICHEVLKKYYFGDEGGLYETE